MLVGNSIKYVMLSAKKFSLLIAQEEAYWRQRANIFWLKDGDSNSIFSMQLLMQGKRKFLSFLVNVNGDIVYDHNGISDAVSSYFHEVFQPESNCNDFLPIINKIPACVFPYDNDSLLAHFTIDKFKNALFQIGSNKSLGLDALNPIFYKKFWHLCGP